MSTLVRIMWIPVLLAACYSGWIFWQRHAANSVAPAPPDWNQNPMAKYGNHVTILQFYPRASEIYAGEKDMLCYGVVNAREVRLDPPVERVWPAVSRCFEVSPTKTTRYTLTAVALDKSISQSVEIVVK